MASYFAHNLCFLRKHAGYSPGEMAAWLNLSEHQWLQFERGDAEPSFDTLIHISDFFNQPVERLLRVDQNLLFRLTQGKKIKLILLDVDGTLTDGSIFYGEGGDQFKRFHSQDGLAIHRMITRHGMEFGFVSAGSTTKIVEYRAEKLGVKKVYCGTRPKVEVANEWLLDMGIDYKQTAYIGDDLNDLPLIKKAGISACPANARPQVKLASQIVLNNRGGDACVREFIEEVMGYDILQ